jgi:hypothetical protein
MGADPERKKSSFVLEGDRDLDAGLGIIIKGRDASCLLTPCRQIREWIFILKEDNSESDADVEKFKKNKAAPEAEGKSRRARSQVAGTRVFQRSDSKVHQDKRLDRADFLFLIELILLAGGSVFRPADQAESGMHGLVGC